MKPIQEKEMEVLCNKVPSEKIFFIVNQLYSKKKLSLRYWYSKVEYEVHVLLLLRRAIGKLLQTE